MLSYHSHTLIHCSWCLFLSTVQWTVSMHCKVTSRSVSLLPTCLFYKQPTHVHLDSFHLCLFDFPFIYQFYSMMNTLLKPTCWNPADLLIFKSFQQHFSIISKFVCCGFYIKKDVAFTLISFALLKWHQCLSVQLPFELHLEIPVQLHLELEVNWLVQNVNELEFELSRI